jgi:hypothetical protein
MMIPFMENFNEFHGFPTMLIYPGKSILSIQNLPKSEGLRAGPTFKWAKVTLP